MNFQNVLGVVVLATIFSRHPSNYFLWGYLKDHMHCTNPQNVQGLQTEIEATAEYITGNMLHDTVDNILVCLHQVHKVKES
jgi:hypothetical protein